MDRLSQYQYELCDNLQFEIEYIHDYSDYIVNGHNCEI